MLLNYHCYFIGGLIGTLPDLANHQISGNFYIVDSKTIFIEDFNYDATAPGQNSERIVVTFAVYYHDFLFVVYNNIIASQNIILWLLLLLITNYYTSCLWFII